MRGREVWWDCCCCDDLALLSPPAPVPGAAPPGGSSAGWPTGRSWLVLQGPMLGRPEMISQDIGQGRGHFIRLGKLTPILVTALQLEAGEVLDSPVESTPSLPAHLTCLLQAPAEPGASSLRRAGGEYRQDQDRSCREPHYSSEIHNLISIDFLSQL